MTKLLVAAALGIGMCAITAAQAAPTLSSSADAASVKLSAGSIVRADALLGSAAGAAPPTYDANGDLVQIKQKAQLVAASLLRPLAANQALTSNAVTARASASGSSATGSTSLVDANLSLGTIALTSLGLSADKITSTTIAGIDPSGLFARGSSSIENLGVGGNVLGLVTIDGSLFVNADPNTVILDNLGILITLNEQGMVQDATSISMFTNAIHVSLSNYLLNGQLVSGDIVLGHSQAAVTGFSPAAAVPEPATWAMMIMGFGLVGRAMRGSGRRSAVYG